MKGEFPKSLNQLKKPKENDHMEVKMFEESNADDMQQLVNDWFKQNSSVKIHTINQSESACWDGEDMVANLTISIFFER